MESDKWPNPVGLHTGEGRGHPAAKFMLQIPNKLQYNEVYAGSDVSEKKVVYRQAGVACLWNTLM